MASAPIGMMMLIPKTMPTPEGWLHCNYACYSQEQFPELFTWFQSNRLASDPPGFFRVPNEQPVISPTAIVKMIVKAG